jgi:hypothetical protein
MTREPGGMERFIESLKESPPRKDVFNPWYDVDSEHEISALGCQIRKRQLAQYLTERIGTAKYLLLGEASGYQGGHFSGIPMTSERILLGKQAAKGISPEHVFRGIIPERTSRPEVRSGGFSEPTATIVWGLIIGLKMDPYQFILWNSYPWHPFDPKKGMLSNRTPDKEEFLKGLPVLNELLDMVRFKRIFALGNKARDQLQGGGIAATTVRHPANAGAAEFRRQLARYLKGDA